MKRAMLAVIMAAIVGFGAAASAREASTVTGEVVSLNCYLKNKTEAVGEAHKDCAVLTARRGGPLAILTADELYIVKGEWTKNKNERLIDFIATRVTATGEVVDVNGKKMINVTDVTAAH
jgi:hypothetical protein